ncbi:hypothetical protein LIER_21650 [Lithospermum erythrorhizon]|uniref:Bulb-type lectin domain-containing protein n=1 Tax=Lithospermum erythrorhizon TaxID=34254 RepID=A0AAV3QTD2_LITER
MQHKILFIALVLVLIQLINAQPFDYPIGNLSTTWFNTESAPHSVRFTDTTIVRAILLRGSFGPRYACGFYCNGTCDSYLFAVFIVQTNSGSGIVQPAIGFPQVVWSANRNNPVKLNSTLQLTSDGNLVLRDADGSLAWSTNTPGKGVVGLNMTDNGNLVMFDRNNKVVWQSFDHPTDSLVPGQRLFPGQKLTSSVSETNWKRGQFYMALQHRRLSVMTNTSPPKVYAEILSTRTSKKLRYAQFRNGSLDLYVDQSKLAASVSIRLASSAQYMKLRPDGHLKVYEWASGWKEIADLNKN